MKIDDMTQSEDNKTTNGFLGLKLSTKRGAKLEKLKEICEEAILDNELDTLVRKAVVKCLSEELEREKKKA